MTINIVTARNDYIGNNTTDQYNYDFKIFAKTHLQVSVTDTDSETTILTVDTDYTVDGVGDSDGGTITLLDGNLAAGYKLTIFRLIPIDQTTSIRNQGSFYPEIHEDAFDRLVMQVQMLAEKLSRTVQLPIPTKVADIDTVVPGEMLPDSTFFLNPDGDGFYLVTRTDLTGGVGPAGPAGPDGPAGADGINGTDGNGVLNGVTPPGPSDGADGDFYIDTASWMIYGPKAGTWPAGTSLIPAGNGVQRCGSEDISSGVSTHTVTFSSPMPSAAYRPSWKFANFADSVDNLIFLQGMLVDQDENGFTVKLNAETDTANYKINYEVFLDA